MYRRGKTPRYLNFRTGVELPPELAGKTAAEVAAYYQDQIKLQKDTYEAALENLGGGTGNGSGSGSGTPAAPPSPTPRGPTVGEFLADPAGRTADLIKQNSVSREEFQAATTQVRDSMIYTARERAMKDIKRQADASGDSYDWDKMESKLIELANKSMPETLVNPETWKAIYYYNRGLLTGTLVKEAVTKATMPMESGAPGGNAPAAPLPLTAEEQVVVDGLGLTAETYRESGERMRKQQFPLTMDNRSRK